MVKAPKKRSFLRVVIKFISFIALISLLWSYSAMWLSPDLYWLPAFFGLAYPFILILNLLLLIYWIFKNRWYALVILIGIFIGFFYLRALIPLNFGTKEPHNDSLIKVMSFNVKNFDLYNYKKNWQLNFEKRNLIFKYLKKEKPAIVCFQEYYNDDTGKFITTDSLVDILQTNHYYFVPTKVNKQFHKFGIATFSRFPIINNGKIEFKTRTGNECIYNDILINNDTVRVYNIHFESIRLGSEDYLFAEKVKNANNLNNTDEISINSKRILNRLKIGFIARADQVRQVVSNIKTCNYPIILCGDFNDTPFSYTYHQLDNLLIDSFVESGTGSGKTYAGSFPSFRIDYILHSNFYKAIFYKTDYVDLSDHYPIITYLQKK